MSTLEKVRLRRNRESLPKMRSKRDSDEGFGCFEGVEDASSEGISMILEPRRWDAVDCLSNPHKAPGLDVEEDVVTDPAIPEFNPT